MDGRKEENPVITQLLKQKTAVITRMHTTGNFAKRCALGKEVDAIDAQIKELRASNSSPMDMLISTLEMKLGTLDTRYHVSGNFGTRESIQKEKTGVTEQVAGLKAQKTATTNAELVAAFELQLSGLTKQQEALTSQSQYTGNFHEKISLGQLAALAAGQADALKATIAHYTPQKTFKG